MTTDGQPAPFCLTNMKPTGRWGLSQRDSDGRWSSTGTLGFERREDAEEAVRQSERTQPGRWRVRDRGAWREDGGRTP